MSITFGFHERASVLGVAGKLRLAASDTPDPVYDEERIRARAAIIQVAIDARSRHLPDEAPFEYLPFANLADDYRYEGETIDRVVTNYNLHDLAI